MTVSRLKGCKAGVYADAGRRLIYAQAELGNFDCRVKKREEVCEGELGGRHGGLGVGIVVCFGFCSAFVCSLKLGGQGSVIRMDVSTTPSQRLGRGKLLTDWTYFCGRVFIV